ncbi:MAG: type I-E CRISPR-associated protein Cse2/CasB [Chloroflexota bacterium]|nr:type I-E CRISPR-associated protein Cse2/CasB [Chloroflexota bacterium]
MTTHLSERTAATEEEYAFIAHLTRLLEHADRSLARAAMAHLRRGLGKPAGAAYEMDRYILPKLPQRASPFDEERYYLVACLFALWHQGKDRAEILDGAWDTDRNLGRSLRLMVNQESDLGKRENLEKSTGKRLNALLNSHRDDLRHHLRRIAALLRSREVPVNWRQLLHDLRYWDADDRSVQHAWARGFWIWRKTE